MTHQDTDRTHDMTRQDDDRTSSGHVTVEEAARLLDVSVDAVRKRIERGTLHSEKVGKTRYVFLDDDMTQQDTHRIGHDTDPDADRTQHDSDMTPLVASMQDQIDTLKQELEDWKEEARRKDAILMTMAQRIPELETPSEAPEPPVSSPEATDKGTAPPEQQEPPQRRSWLHRFFFGP